MKVAKILSLFIFILLFLYPAEVHKWSALLFFLIPVFFFIRNEIKIPKPSILLAFFLVTFLLLSLLNRLTYFSLVYLSYTVILISFFIFAFQLEKVEILKLTVLASLPAIFYGYYQKFFLFQDYLSNFNEKLKGFPHLAGSRIIERLKEGRVFSLFPLPTSFCFFLSIIFLFSIGIAFSQNKLKKKIFYLSIALLSLILMIFTKSFGGILGLSGGFFLFLFITGKKDLKILLILLIISIAIISTIFYLRFDTLSTKNPLTLRLSNWKIALRVISEHPLFGVGFGNFPSFSLPFAKERFEATKYAHNFFLHFFAEGGIFCIIFLLAVLFEWFDKVSKNISSTPLEASVWGALFSIFLYNFIDIGIFFESFGFLTMLIFSFLLKGENFLRIQGGKKLLFALSLFAILLFPSWTYLTEELLQRANLSFGENLAYSERILLLTKKINPFNPKVYSYLSFVESKKGNLLLSLEYLDRSISLYPYSHSLYYERSIILLKMRRHLEAYFFLKEAENMNPSFIPYRNERKDLEDFLFRGRND